MMAKRAKFRVGQVVVPITGVSKGFPLKIKEISEGSTPAKTLVWLRNPAIKNGLQGYIATSLRPLTRRERGNAR